MCLGIPAKVIEINKETLIGKVNVGGIEKEANFQLVPDIKIGDYVLLHAGFAIQTLDKKEAKKTLSMLKELLK